MYNIRDLLDSAEKAAHEFGAYNAVQIKSILNALSRAGKEKAVFYAKWSVEETGRGNIEDNIKKLRFCITDLTNRYSPSDFTAPVTDCEKNIISFPKPAGILAALIPGTNPIMTIYYKVLMSIITRNVIIFSPHPAARESAIDAVDFMARIAEDAGAPEGTIQVLRTEGISYLNDLMESPKVNLILATGGRGRVKAAYRSGNPALGMGPGNAPCYVHRSADIRTAAQQIICSNSFDHALPCVCESVIMADRDIDSRLRKALGASGGYFITKKDEQPLYEYLYPAGQMNTQAIGKSAAWIAEQAGITIPPDMKSLIVGINRVGKNQPLSQEKMFPIMGYIVVDGVEQAIDTALTMLQTSGKGHSAIIHSDDPSVVSHYATAMPVCRIAVNTQGVEGSGGMSTHLTPGPMVGTGFFGGSSVDDNISPKHLVQWCRVAYPKDAVLAEMKNTAKVNNGNMTKVTGSIDVEYIGESKNIALFIINRQEKANAYENEMIRSFTTSFSEAVANPSIRAAIITGGGKRFFCSGADISSLSGRSYQDGLNLMSRQLFQTIADAPWPTIAAICGPAIAGGLELALACDMRICTASSSFALPEIDLGLIPAAGGIARLSALIGEARAKEMVLFGRKIDDKTALQWGVVSSISEHVLDDAIALAEAVVKRDQLAVRLAKMALQSTLPPSRESTNIESISQALLYHRKTQGK